MDFSVRPVQSNVTAGWLKHKHYAKRIPPISHSYGLYDSELILQGVCTYGPPCRMLNKGYGIFGGEFEVDTLELNRLVVNDNLPKNTLSFFVSQTFKLLPAPICLVSYADSNAGHHGYIYQATNWIYTGITGIEATYFDKRQNIILHPRTVVGMFGSRSAETLPDYIVVNKESGGKFRYIKFLGSKKDIKSMNGFLKYQVSEYPKGDNKRYDSSHKPSVQRVLF